MNEDDSDERDEMGAPMYADESADIDRQQQTHPERIDLREYDKSDRLELSDTALNAIEELNSDIGGTRIAVEHYRDGTVTLGSSQYVGTVSLPDGPEVRIRPKAAGTNFLELLRWAHGIQPKVHEERTRAETGRTFIDALGFLYAAELETLLQRGPHREYQWTEETQQKVRGRLDLQRQLQQQRLASTEFELVYEELTADTVANRGIQQAAQRMSRLVRDRTLASRLRQQSHQLSRWVGDELVSPAELARVETTRLNEHYATTLRLAEQILRQRFLDDFARVEHSSFGLMVNMNTVFENAVERTARSVFDEKSGWRVQTQERIPPIATGGTPPVNMYPDFLLERDGIPQLVGDAKWKTDVKQQDIYQMSAYMLALDVPGLLLYPEQINSWNSIETSYDVDERFELRLTELPTATDSADQAFSKRLQASFDAVVSDLLFER